MSLISRQSRFQYSARRLSRALTGEPVRRFHVPGSQSLLSAVFGRISLLYRSALIYSQAGARVGVNRIFLDSGGLSGPGAIVIGTDLRSCRARIFV